MDQSTHTRIVAGTTYVDEQPLIDGFQHHRLYEALRHRDTARPIHGAADNHDLHPDTLFWHFNWKDCGGIACKLNDEDDLGIIIEINHEPFVIFMVENDISQDRWMQLVQTCQQRIRTAVGS